jgi:hypothetical protein
MLRPGAPIAKRVQALHARANTAASISAQPAERNATAHAASVAPVVSTSSTSSARRGTAATERTRGG